MANLLLDAYLPHLEPGCCPAKVYALVFNRSHQALKDPGTGVLVMTNFVKAQQNSFAITLNEHTERTKYYYLDLDQSDFTLADNAFGSEYYIEIWRRELSGNFNRDQDILEETRRLYWAGGRIAQSQLDPSQEDRLANYQAHVALAYDSENQTAYILGFLDKNGILQENTQQCEFQWLDHSGAELANVTTTSFLPNAPGVFSISLPSINLTPDRIGVMMATITDVAGGTHKTASTSIHWD
jgi:hypothetical protein